MKKLSSIICMSLILLLFSSCQPDLTDDVEMAYENATNSDGYMWSPKASSSMTWHDAVSYCNNLTKYGYSDWHLPTISELRTLIKNCSGTVTGGSCGVTDSCLSYSNCRNDACSGCSSDLSGKYSKLGDSSWLWSSSVLSDHSDLAWAVDFFNGSVGNDYKGYINYVRCVR